MVGVLPNTERKPLPRKRERPVESDLSKGIRNVQSSAVFYDVKRTRINPSTSIPSSVGTPSIIRSAVDILTELYKGIDGGWDRQSLTSKLREFSNDHLAFIATKDHSECCQLLVKISSSIKLLDSSRDCLHYCLAILKDSPAANQIWTRIVHLLTDGYHEKQGLCSRSSLHACLLPLFECAALKGLLLSDEVTVVREIVENSLYSLDRERRIAAVNFLVTDIVQAKSPNTERYDWLEKVLCRTVADRDKRVRVASVRGLAAMSKTERTLSLRMYPMVKRLCEGSEAFVRIESLRMLKVFSDKYPEKEVKNRNNVSLRLVDEAFSIVCHALNDSEVTVRTEAAKLLGSFSRVSDSFLDQTLDKKLLNAMRMSKTKETRFHRKPVYEGSSYKAHCHGHATAASDWSTGKKLGEDVPAERVDEERVSMIPIGACGAFVTALEDEFMSVRQAGVYSLGKLAANRPLFAAAALDHLADMFNDEIEEVRLDAVRAITPLVMHGVLVKEQLDTILTVLDDALPDSREALRELLKNAQLESPGCVEYSVKALLNCLQRFPLDRLSVFSCLSKLGLRHASFIQPLVDDLLNLDSTFDVAEPPIDDNFYLAKLILVLNAASEYDPICSLLPDFVVRHYYFLRRAMPELVPSIAALSDDIDVDTVLREISKDSYGQRTRKLLEFAFEQMQCAFKTDSFQQRNFLQKLIIRDMNKMYELDESVAGTARFLAALQQVLMHCDIVSQILVHGGDLRAASGVVDKALLLVNVLESTFRNVDISMRSFVVECRFQLQIQKIAVFLDLFPDLLGSGAELVNVEIEAFRSRTIALNGTMTTSANELIDNIITQINVADKKKIFNGQQLASPFEKQLLSFPKRFPSNGEVAVKWAEIVEPSEDMTDPLRFIAGLPLGISLNILLHNFEVSDLDKFRIEIRYPDQSSNLIQPLKHNFKEISPSTYRLTSSVLLHGTTWSEAAGVHLSCVLLSSQSPILPTSCSMSNSVYTSSLKSSVIPISKSPLSVKQSSVEVTIFPMHKSC